MPAVWPVALAVCLPLFLLLEPCAADNAIYTWCAQFAAKSMKKESGQPISPQSEPLKVFSVGLSHTGTSSLHAALSELGYNTWHGHHIDTESGEALSDAYMTGDSSRFLDLLASTGFNASVELMYFPVVRDALARYPEARVILSVRDSAEKQAESYLRTLSAARHMAYGPVGLLFDLAGLSPIFYRMWCSNFEWQRSAGSISPPAVVEQCGSPDAVKKSAWWAHVFDESKEQENMVVIAEQYEKMNAALRKAVPQEQLLEFNVKQGYGPLCRFLGVPEDGCPAAFPHVNDAASMVATGRFFAAVRYGWWVPVLLLFLCVVRRPRKPREAKKND